MAAMRYAISNGIGDDGKFDGCQIIIRKDFGLKGRLNRLTEQIQDLWEKQPGVEHFHFRKDFQSALNLFTQRQEHFLTQQLTRPEKVSTPFECLPSKRAERPCYLCLVT